MANIDIKVLGMTNQHEAYVVSSNRSFKISEFLIIEDKKQGDIFAQLVQVNTYNKYLPMKPEEGAIDDETLKNMASMGFNIEDDTVYLGKIRLLKEGNFAIETGSLCRTPSFEEVKEYFITVGKDKGLIMGTIRNTQEIYETTDIELKDILKTFEKDNILDQFEVPYIYNIRSMTQYPHVGIFGGSGSGKSFGIRVMLEEIMKQEIPTVVLDPHYEMDFSDVFPGMQKVDYSNKFEIFRVGENAGIKFKDLNSKDLKTILSTSAALSEAMKNIVDTIHERKDTLNSFTEKLNYLLQGFILGNELHNELEKAKQQKNQVEIEKYEKIQKIYEKYKNVSNEASVKGIFWRLDHVNKMNLFNYDIENMINALKNRKLIVIQGNIKIMQVFSTYFINKIYALRRDFKDTQKLANSSTADYFPPFVLVTDEAHNFAPQSKDGQSEVPSKSIIREIAQEGRKYGVFLVLATQRPSLLDSTVTAQLNTKFIFRTTREMDIATIKQETDIGSDEAKRLPYLQTGDSFVSESAIGRTMYVRIRVANTKSPQSEDPFDEMEKLASKIFNDMFSIISQYLPIEEFSLSNVAEEIEKEYKITMNVDELKMFLKDACEKDLLIKEESPFGMIYKKKGQ